MHNNINIKAEPSVHFNFSNKTHLHNFQDSGRQIIHLLHGIFFKYYSHACFPVNLHFKGVPSLNLDHGIQWGNMRVTCYKSSVDPLNLPTF